MALIPPMPMFLDVSTTRVGLKASTRQLVHVSRFRANARGGSVPDVAIACYDEQGHGSDFLCYFYGQVREAGEHLSLFGATGASPTQSYIALSHTEIVVAHLQDARWEQGEGLVMVTWADDRVPGLRARVHFWVPPVWRNPRVTAYAGKVLLATYFEDLGYHVLEGRTPAMNRLALRFITRLGFQLGAPIPHAEWVMQPGGGVRLGSVVPSYMTGQMFKASAQRKDA